MSKKAKETIREKNRTPKKAQKDQPHEETRIPTEAAIEGYSEVDIEQVIRSAQLMRDCVNTFHDRTDCPKPRLLESEDRCTNLANDAQAIMGIAHRLYNRHINMIKHTGRTDCKFLRAYLILEEVAEAMLALADNDETSLLDALADLLYVTYGTAVVYDLPLGAGFAAVHLSNMTKNTCRGAKNNTDGDRGKNEGYREPCLPRLLQDYRTGNDEVNLDVKPYPAVEYPRSSQQLLLWEALTTAKTEVEQRRIEDHEPNGT